MSKHTKHLVEWHPEQRAVKIPGVQPRDPAATSMFSTHNMMENYSGVEVTETTALNISAIWAAVVVISSSLGMLPCEMYKRLSRRAYECEETHAAVSILDEPNPEMTAPVFKETLQAHALTWGMGYAEIEFTLGGDPMGLWPLTPDRVTPVRVDGRVGYIVKDPGATPKYVPADRMFVIPGFGFDGVRGYNVVRMAQQSFGLTAAAERFGAASFGNGGVPSGFVSTEHKYSDNAIQQFINDYNKEHRGSGNAGKIGLLHDGMKWNPMSQAPDAMQFLGTRVFQLQEIARWFNIPPHMLRDLERATFSNIEEQSLNYVIYTLQPWIVKWNAEYKRKLCRPETRKLYFFDHNPDMLLKGKMLDRYKAYAIGRMGGWLSANDVLAKEHENPLETGQGGDVYLVPTNQTKITDAGPVLPEDPNAGAKP